LLLVACGGSDKKESGTADEFLKKEQAALKEKQAAKGTEGKKADEGTKVAEAPKPAPAAEPAPAPAAPPTPAPTAPAATGSPSTPPPTGIVRQALLMVRRGKYEDAIRQAKAALRRDEKYVPAMVVMARAYYHLNKLEFADSICDIALGIRASTGECYNIKGFIALKNKNDPLAKAHFEKATQVQPGLGPPWLNLGAQHLKTKSYDRAAPALEKAVGLMPSRAEAHLNLGSAYRGQNQVVKAYNSYKKALQLRPTYPAAYFNLGILFLDAQSYPGMDKLQQLNQAVAHFNKYKQQMSYLSKDDPVDGYIAEAQKNYKREQKRREREARRKAREAARKKPKPAPEPEKKDDKKDDKPKGGGG
jgi:tetratricopeptide (TPR) repeat protein